MRRFILGLVVVLFAAGQAGAQISTGPYGSLVMVDSTGKIVGGVSDVGPPDDAFGSFIQTVTIDTSEGAGFISYSRKRSAFSREGVLQFTSANCLGPAYVDSTSLSPGLDGGLGLAVVSKPPGQSLYAATGPDTTVTIQSFLAGEDCFASLLTSEYTPVTYVGDLSAEFTPPFSIESVPVVIDPEWIPAGIPLPEWVVTAVVGFMLGVYYMKTKRDEVVAA